MSPPQQPQPRQQQLLLRQQQQLLLLQLQQPRQLQRPRQQQQRPRQQLQRPRLLQLLLVNGAFGLPGQAVLVSAMDLASEIELAIALLLPQPLVLPRTRPKPKNVLRLRHHVAVSETQQIHEYMPKNFQPELYP